jgi:hypothetical protein
MVMTYSLRGIKRRGMGTLGLIVVVVAVFVVLAFFGVFGLHL